MGKGCPAEHPAAGVTLYQGDSLAVLPTIADGSADCMITDPPYSSGGATHAIRTQDVAAKYQQHGTRKRYPSFAGDQRDSRSWGYWCSLWLGECLRIVKPGGYGLMFCDWRQLPRATDAFQAGGWVWRGLIAWDKTDGSRAPHKGYFRHQCEYVVWGTKGACPVPPLDDPRGGPWPGCVRVPVRHAEKLHLTGKPVGLMRALVRCCPPGGLVLDPFGGSGTTAQAAIAEGRRAVLVEQEADYAGVIRRRLTDP